MEPSISCAGFHDNHLISFCLSADMTPSPGITPAEELELIRRKHDLRQAVLNDEDVLWCESKHWSMLFIPKLCLDLPQLLIPTSYD